MSTTTHKLLRTTKQAGMVSIMVTLILMIVISLIVLGFAQISRRNQRQALDRQLSTQAFYAAETGVNDAASLIKTKVAAGVAVAAKTTCGGGGAFYSTLPTNVLDSTTDVSYTCLLVDPAPTELKYTDIGTTSTIVPLNAASGNIARLTLTWNSKDDASAPITGCPAAVGTLPVNTSWSCGYGVLRFDLVPTTGSLTMAGLQSSTMTTFAMPLNAAGTNSVNYAGGPNNDLLGVNCTNADCHLTINFPTPQPNYYMRISSLYKDVSLRIDATDITGTAISLTGAQAVIDSTGRAQDVLRRIQVHVPLTTSQNLLSDYALESTDAICKRFVVMNGYFQSYADAAVPGLGASSTNPLCK